MNYLSLDSRLRTTDSTTSYLSGVLEKVDRTLNQPLVDYKWTRDMPIRTDATIATEAVSFIKSTFKRTGTQLVQGKPWVTQNATVKPNITLDNEKNVTQMHPLSWKLEYDFIELQKSIAGNFNLIQQLDNSLKIDYNLAADEMVYVGDPYLKVQGLVNSDEVLLTNAVDPGAGTEWVDKNPQQIINDVNSALFASWQNTAFTIVPRVLLLPPAQFNLLIGTTMSDLAEKSIMKYLPSNVLSAFENGMPLSIRQAKYLTGAGVGGLDRMVVYTQDIKRLRFPLVQLQRQQSYYADRYFTPYYAAFGPIEFVYPETVLYVDGI